MASYWCCASSHVVDNTGTTAALKRSRKATSPPRLGSRRIDLGILKRRVISPQRPQFGEHAFCLRMLSELVIAHGEAHLTEPVVGLGFARCPGHLGIAERVVGQPEKGAGLCVCRVERQCVLVGGDGLLVPAREEKSVTERVVRALTQRVQENRTSHGSQPGLGAAHLDGKKAVVLQYAHMAWC